MAQFHEDNDIRREMPYLGLDKTNLLDLRDKKSVESSYNSRNEYQLQLMREKIRSKDIICEGSQQRESQMESESDQSRHKVKLPPINNERNLKQPLGPINHPNPYQQPNIQSQQYPSQYPPQTYPYPPPQQNITIITVQNPPQKPIKRQPIRQSRPITYYSGNTYIYPYYYDSSGCYYCCWFNGNCCPCECCHQCVCNYILCDPWPCCNGCTGFHCECLQCLPCCQIFQCVKNNQCQVCECLPCCSGCQFCNAACDGTCISALPCCNDCQCGELCQILPCCNGCQVEQCLGCLPCCNQDCCNICQCLNGCQIFNCIGGCCQCANGCDVCSICEVCSDCDCAGLGDCICGCLACLGDC